MSAPSLETHRGALQSVSYRMLGSVQEAEEVVQDTFLRAMTHPPADTSRPWRPWLVRVATNLCRDRLRRRRASPYRGPWLPEPATAAWIDPDPGPEARVMRAASASYAWLVAAEALTPEQRAAWVLREVFELDMDDVAGALDCSRPAARALLYRARQRLAASTQAELGSEGHAEAFAALMTALLTGDEAGLRAALAPDVAAVSDADGRYHAAGVPVQGAARVAKLLQGLHRQGAADGQWAMVELHGQPAFVVERSAPAPGWAPRAVMLLGLDAQGRIARIWTVLADPKLHGVPFGA